MQFKYLLLIFVFTIVSAALGAEAWIDFKRDADAEERNADSEAWRSIIEDISKAVTINYGKGIYSITSNNCEHRSGQFDGKFWKPSFWLYKELKSEADEFNYQNSFYKGYKSHIGNCIRRAGESRNYTRTKHQIEQEKFDGRIVLQPTPSM
ncbi:hypothetical protein RhiirA5_456198 [Rhizophagus irregularis]|uniref:Uncharacterized protein n=1 Tax=Rhizophagus irregularis TaxID=588596 RepID=A0A2N0RTC5_9GLOM|nr:hypothetical protein RhiirA5_456198 [Rhizophagus irregularis]PKC66557.1 hypothetical protein RhiirA1_511843 [Rhizophagus irregularis]CAB4477634.1 unnamed protein product [Rhizophagus irregularis]CAB5211800.1 unnamed protein product [Rhizophagus irregularis]CAB5368089.1 unnamed protein product [Rhizophagus irregularis]